VLDRAQRDNRLGEVAQAAVAVLMKATRAENASTDLIDHIASAWAMTRNSGTNLADALEIRRWSLQRALESGDLTRSVTLAAEVAEDHENALPDGDPRIAETRRLLRHAYASAARWEDAIALDEENYQDHIRRFGVDHPSTLNARNALGYPCARRAAGSTGPRRCTAPTSPMPCACAGRTTRPRCGPASTSPAPAGRWAA
jgi:hypothetical protein